MRLILMRMIVLIVFAFVAGAATAVSPCVLPVLPVVLSAGVTGGRRRPLGVATGLALSFTFATVALVYTISALGLPDGLLRTFSIVVLIVFGVSLLVPWVGDHVETWLSRIAPRLRFRVPVIRRAVVSGPAHSSAAAWGSSTPHAPDRSSRA